MMVDSMASAACNVHPWQNNASMLNFLCLVRPENEIRGSGSHLIDRIGSKRLGTPRSADGGLDVSGLRQLLWPVQRQQRTQRVRVVHHALMFGAHIGRMHPIT